MPTAVEWIPSLSIFEGESTADRLCRFVRSFGGVSLSKNTERLEQLVGRGVDPWGLESYRWLTNCGTSALGFIAAACGTRAYAKEFHPLLATVSVNGTSPAWLYKIGRDLDLIRDVDDYYEGYKGQLVSYANGGHFEWILEDMEQALTGVVEHGGGGRPNNEITIGRGDVRKSMGRPITHVFNFCQNLPESDPLPSGELERVYSGPGHEMAPTGE